MKAIVPTEITGKPLPCVVRWIGRKGLSVRALTWCGDDYSAADGVGQVPDEIKTCESCNGEIVKAVTIAKHTGGA